MCVSNILWTSAGMAGCFGPMSLKPRTQIFLKPKCFWKHKCFQTPNVRLVSSFATICQFTTTHYSFVRSFVLLAFEGVSTDMWAISNIIRASLTVTYKTVTYGQLCKHQPCQPWVQGECTRLIPRDSEASSRKIGCLTVWLQPSHWVYIQDYSNAVDRFWCRGLRRSEEEQLSRSAASLLIGRSHNCTKSFIFHSFGDCVDNLTPMRIAEQRIVFC